MAGETTITTTDYLLEEYGEEEEDRNHDNNPLDKPMTASLATVIIAGSLATRSANVGRKTKTSKTGYNDEV